jgi:Protein of unknown function (DUF2892)
MRLIRINVGDGDRIFRMVLGIALLSLTTFLDSPWRWWGFLGFVPLGTGLTARCPIYSLLGINTCRHPSRVRKE